MKEIRNKIISSLPNNILYKIEMVIGKNKRMFLQSLRLNKYLEKKDFLQLDVSNFPSCYVTKGEFDFPLFQMFFLDNMLSLCIYCIANGYLPIIEYRNSEGINLWEQFLEQPFKDIHLKRKEKIFHVCDMSKVDIKLMSEFPTKKEIKRYNEILKKLVKLNKKTDEYLQKEEKNIFKPNQRVIGVLCRGTDYTANKPKGHPVQPKVEKVIELAKIKMKEYDCPYIYLATEEKRIEEKFEEEFPGKILTNKRNYYDEFYNIRKTKGNQARISLVNFERENDSYYKSLEYISSINLLSKCNLLIGGSTGGTRMALVLNNDRYEYVNLFNKGLY